MTTTLTVFDEAYRALMVAKNIDEVKQVRDRAEALRLYLKQQGESLEMQNACAEIKIRAERRAGEILKDMPKNEGTRGQLAGRNSSGGFIVEPPENELETLADIGISKAQSFRFQSIASIPEDMFEQKIAEIKDQQEELTSKKFLAEAKQELARLRVPESATTPPLPPNKYRCIVIDPPWPMKKIEREERPNQGVELDYPTMSLEEIEALPVGEMADESGCHLYLWVTQKYLPTGLELVEKWGFHYQCLMTWRKNVGITPYSWMYDTEHVIFARRGNLPLDRLGLRLSFDAPVNGHSVKPDTFFIERVIPASPGPRLEMFARKQRDGFEVWGNEV